MMKLFLSNDFNLDYELICNCHCNVSPINEAIDTYDQFIIRLMTCDWIKYTCRFILASKINLMVNGNDFVASNGCKI